LERDTCRRGAFFLYWDSNAFALGFAKTDLVSTIYMHYDEFRGFAPIGIME